MFVRIEAITANRALGGLVYLWSWKYKKIHWKLMIDQKFIIVFQISRPKNIYQKWFSTKNRPLDVRFQMRQTRTMGAFIFGKIKQNPLCNVLKCFKKIGPWLSHVFSRNQNPLWLGYVSFETWHPNVYFEYWIIFKGYLRAEVFETQYLTFGQSLIFNVFLYLPYSSQQAGQLKTFHQMSQYWP